MNLHASLRRIGALFVKECQQVLRDPSALLVAGVLPLLLMFLFAFAVSLDLKRVPVGLVMQTDTPAARSLASAFAGSRYFRIHPGRDPREFEAALGAGRLAGVVRIPADFDARLAHGRQPLVQVVTDGSQPNTAAFVGQFARGVVEQWRAQSSAPALSLQPRFRFNPELESRQVLVPGAIAIVMTIIGTLLTALVLAREWERGTLEALLATPVRITEVLIGKLLPYFGLGLLATLATTALAVWAFGLPLRGSVASLLLISAMFLLPALGQGLLISTLARNQFIAAQLALFTGFLPAFLLSGFLFEIASMPAPLRWLTHVVAARWFLESLQTVFLVGDAWHSLWPNLLALLAIGAALFALARLFTRRSLEP
jgi:ABC-2 type transport system permease protein